MKFNIDWFFLLLMVLIVASVIRHGCRSHYAHLEKMEKIRLN